MLYLSNLITSFRGHYKVFTSVFILINFWSITSTEQWSPGACTTTTIIIWEFIRNVNSQATSLTLREIQVHAKIWDLLQEE